MADKLPEPDTDIDDFSPEDVYCPYCGENAGTFRPRKRMVCQQCGRDFKLDLNPERNQRIPQEGDWKKTNE